MHTQDDNATQQIAHMTPYDQAVLETAAYGIHGVLRQHDAATADIFAQRVGLDGPAPSRATVAIAMYRWVHTAINHQAAR
jgi:hypothetical protein